MKKTNRAARRYEAPRPPEKAIDREPVVRQPGVSEAARSTSLTVVGAVIGTLVGGPIGAVVGIIIGGVAAAVMDSLNPSGSNSKKPA